MRAFENLRLNLRKNLMYKTINVYFQVKKKKEIGKQSSYTISKRIQEEKKHFISTFQRFVVFAVLFYVDAFSV